jgi:integrase
MPTHVKLTKRSIDALVPTGKIAYVWDEALRGFGIRVNKAGRKTYVVFYRTRERTKRLMTIGYTTQLSPDEARAKALEIIATVARGGDPARGQAEIRSGLTMAQLADRYQIEHAKVRKKASSAKEDRRIWDKYVLPALGRRSVAGITRGDIAGLHGGLGANPYQANRVLSLLSKAFSLAELWEVRPQKSNPCAGVKKFPETARVATMSAEQIHALGRALDAYHDQRVALAIKLYLFTGCRKSEILRATWDDVDFTQGILRLPDSKTGEGLVELPPEIIEELRRYEGTRELNPFLIPGRRKGARLVNISKPWAQIRKAAGLPALRIHDLRHVYGSLAHALGNSQRTVATLLRHKRLSTTERYLHAHDEHRKQASGATARAISAALAGAEKPQKDA